MKKLSQIDLASDARARRFVKDEIVTVEFADAAGSIVSREGPNRYAKGDALIKGSTGDDWSVSRNRFDAKYVPVPPLTHGSDGRYKNKPLPVLALQMDEAFALERSSGGDLIKGNAGDWLCCYIQVATKFSSALQTGD